MRPNLMRARHRNEKNPVCMSNRPGAVESSLQKRPVQVTTGRPLTPISGKCGDGFCIQIHDSKQMIFRVSHVELIADKHSSLRTVELGRFECSVSSPIAAAANNRLQFARH